MNFQLRHDLPWHGEARDLLYRLYTDDDLNRALAGLRHLKGREVVDLRVDADTDTAERTVAIELDMPVPRSLRRLLAGGDRLGWEEVSRCDLRAQRIDFEIRLPRLGERIQAGGSYQLADAAGGVVTRHIHGSVQVDAPVVGALAERVVVDRLRQNMDEEARLTADWLRAR